MSLFPLPLKGKYLGKERWELIAPFEYNNPPIIIEMPIGFVTDGASIPRFAYSLIGSPWGGRYSPASIIHDYLYFIQKYSRRKSDRIFLDAMKILEVPLWKRQLMYLAVRFFGWKAWNKHRKI